MSDQLMVVHTRLRLEDGYPDPEYHRKMEHVRLYFAASGANAGKGELADWKYQEVKIPAGMTVPWPPAAYCSAISKTQWFFSFVEQKIVKGWFQQGINVWRFGNHASLESKESVIAIDPNRDYMGNLGDIDKLENDRKYQPVSVTMVKDSLYVTSMLGEFKPQGDTLWSKRTTENNVVTHKHLQKQIDASSHCVCSVLDGSTDFIKYVHLLTHNPQTHEVHINTVSKETFTSIADANNTVSWTSTRLTVAGDSDHLWYGPGSETLPIQGIITTDSKSKDRKLYIFYILQKMSSRICYSYINLTSDGYVKTDATGDAMAHGPASVPKTDLKRVQYDKKAYSLRGNFRVCAFADRVWVFFTAGDHSCMYCSVPVEADGTIDVKKWRHEAGDKISNVAPSNDSSIINLYEPIVVSKDMLPALG